jgi:hypothetical protein
MTIFKLKPKQSPTIDTDIVELNKASDHPEWQDYLNHLSKVSADYASNDEMKWRDVEKMDNARLDKATNPFYAKDRKYTKVNVQGVMDNPSLIDDFSVANQITAHINKLVKQLESKKINDNAQNECFRGVAPEFFRNASLHYTDEESQEKDIYSRQRDYRQTLFNRHCFVTDAESNSIESARIARLNHWLIAELNSLPLLQAVVIEDAPANKPGYNLAFAKRDTKLKSV